MAVSRRSFLKSTAAVTAVSAMSGTVNSVLGKQSGVEAVTTPNKFKGRVAINFNKDAVSSNGKTANADIIKKMVDEAVMELTKGDRTEDSVGAAWQAIFPASLTANSKIAIKTNFYAPSISPPPAALLGIVEGLRKMKVGGADFTGDITIYEGNTSNNFSQTGYDSAVFGAGTLKVKLEKASFASGSDPATGESNYATVLNQADFLINVFSARGHDPSYTEGVSLGFKSHYGTYPASGTSIHGSPGFSQRVRNLHCTGVVSKKQVLSISCAFFCNNEGRGMSSTSAQSFSNYVKTMDPEATCTSPSTMIMSTDAISCEVQAIKLLRLNKSPAGKYGVSDMPKYLRASAGVEGALTDETYNIGEIDESKMDIRKIINGTGTTPIIPSTSNRSDTPDVQLRATSLQGQNSTHFEFKLPSRYQGTSAHIFVHDLQGRLVFSHEMAVNGILNHFSWNQRDTSGRKVGSGNYVGILKAGRISRTASFMLR